MSAIDLRSDTVTLPSPSMREAMYRAELGDDVYGEDPTVNKLQEMAAERLGTEAALFVSSGTMGNLVSLLTHCGRGNEIIVGDQSHIILHEQGGAAALGGIFSRTVKNATTGELPLEEIAKLINFADDDHVAKTKLICLENTWNGCVLKPAYMKSVAELARKNGLAMHLDGARVFNASVALGLPVSEVVAKFDTVQFCCSKGLSAPAGSMLCGPTDFIKEAKRNRKILGGGMRQVGVLAAACIVALEEMVERLAEDHLNARLLADSIVGCKNIVIDPASVHTNIVIFEVTGDSALTADQLVTRFKEAGLLTLALDKTHIRAVTHYGITRKDVESAARIISNAMSEQRQEARATAGSSTRYGGTGANQ